MSPDDTVPRDDDALADDDHVTVVADRALAARLGRRDMPDQVEPLDGRHLS